MAGLQAVIASNTIAVNAKSSDTAASTNSASLQTVITMLESQATEIATLTALVEKNSEAIAKAESVGGALATATASTSATANSIFAVLATAVATGSATANSNFELLAAAVDNHSKSVDGKVDLLEAAMSATR